jgi:hypothetical protein
MHDWVHVGRASSELSRMLLEPILDNLGPMTRCIVLLESYISKLGFVEKSDMMSSSCGIS